MNLRVAAGQGTSVSGDLTTNVATAVRLVDRAADAGVRLLVLPEAFLTGYDEQVFAGPLPDAEDVAWLAPLQEAAVRANGTVVTCLPLLRAGVPRLAMLVAQPDGRVDFPYDKQHLDGVEKRYFTPGDHGTSLRIEGVELGLSICYDGCFPEHARAAAADGAIGYLNSAAYFAGGEHRRDVYYAARAVENGMYVVFAGLTGRCGPNRFIGGSAVYDPEGRAVARLGEEEGLAIAELDPELVAATRARHTMLADHRGDLGERRYG
ncbi:carbon-nitrogen hydrolase family protein [Nocardioides limicola]|uniref:carbon-nitrogen hydrolase family protein n=1 Tax=Nocardioides limicola TaxID=2803368 RepID=UPI0027DEA545|nr:carbon-nitrogen hydrolase family protein [Nocardioides sp. DJM-14]